MPTPAVLAGAAFPAPILEVLRRLDEAGHRSWLVGGAVRDLLLHRARETADFDVATPATPEQVTGLFRKVIPTGIAHGTVTVLAGGEKVEVTTFRGEGAYLDGRRPESVTFHTDLEADLSRRDFTMNAMAYDPIAGEFRDPFGGEADMTRRRVRAVGDPAARFGEDGLRPVRAVRFAAQLGYQLEPATRAAIPGARDVVRKVSAERIQIELEKLLLAPHAARGVRLLDHTGLLGVIAPPVAAQPPEVRRHAAAVVARAGPDLVLRLAALLHRLDPGVAHDLLVALRNPRRVAEEAAALIREHRCFASGQATAAAGDDVEVRRWLSRVTPARSAAQLALAEADAGAQPAAHRVAPLTEVENLKVRVRRILDAGTPLSIQDLALDGRAVVVALGSPGPHVGEALRHLLDRVLADPATNTAEALTAEIRRWWAGRGAAL